MRLANRSHFAQEQRERDAVLALASVSASGSAFASVFASALASALRPAGQEPASDGLGGAAGAVFIPARLAGVGGSVADGGCSATLGDGGGGAGGTAFGPPCERRAAERVMSRDPHPGQVTMLSGSESGPTGVLQRGQFISRNPGCWTTKPETRV